MLEEWGLKREKVGSLYLSGFTVHRRAYLRALTISCQRSGHFTRHANGAARYAAWRKSLLSNSAKALSLPRQAAYRAALLA